MTDRLFAIDIISRAQASYDPALYDLGTRPAFLRGFEQMRAIAKNAVNPKERIKTLDPKDYKWENNSDVGES